MNSSQPFTHYMHFPALPVALLSPAEQVETSQILGWMQRLGYFTEDGHSMRVMVLTLLLAEALKLLPSHVDRLLAIRAGLLHDVGKALIPPEVLNKPGALTPAEREVIRLHAPLGARLAASYPDIEPDVVATVRHHHEQYNGLGYPAGLIGLEIPQLSRILAVADVYDALTSDRPYRSAWSHDEALTYLQQHAGEMFDPTVVATFTTIAG